MMSPLEEQLPALAPVVTPLTVEEKKARQRLHVKRTYYRKLNLLQTLRHQVHDLEARYERLLQKQHDPVAHDAPDIGNKQDINAGEPVEAELAELRAKLKEENQAMEQLLAQYQQFEDKMSLWARHNVSVDDEGEEEDMVTQGLAPVSLGFIIPSLRAPISSELCQDIVQRTFQDMNRFRHSPIFLTTGMSVFGWRDKRLRDGDRVKFSLKKLFRGISPLALSLRTWAAMSATGGFSSLYSSSLNVRMNILQHVDEDNVVFFRVISTADGLVQVKTLFLLSRIEIESGYAVLLRSLDHEHLAPYSDHPSVQEQWADYYSWIVFEQTEESGQDCKLDFGGEIVSNVVVDSNAWMLEVLFIAVRWENTVFGPSLSLC
ncbi:hypothetical protein Poli38472_013373 [Pythium oligandrum]|uniref:Uncharacterized protein n=1 Tax=Pythium oligandrum TaxID=41045 RepID=A0A8K1FEF4_PYTOL|nr:hypothetical protein Poli38472_013373 [Pythium oligandrum]|eukprot:TMW57899.1 hypothetical protein Poli38472_013373 [Pythium oligandrum]